MTALLSLQNALVENDVGLALSLTEKPHFAFGLWDQWLWVTDAREPVSFNSMLNESHLSGLALSRLCAAQATATPERAMVCGVHGDVLQASPQSFLGSQSLPQIGHDVQYGELTMRALQQQLEHVQLYICALIQDVELENVVVHLGGLFARTGQFCAPPGTRFAADFACYDDEDGLEASDGTPADARPRVWTCSRLRSTLDVFLLLFRLVALHEIAEEPDFNLPQQELFEWHREAGMDRFNTLSMRWDLQPGAVLSYMHAHSGLFNSVSQVIYFHYPDYERRLQLPLKALNAQDGVAAVHTLPLLLELEPDVEVYDEESPLNAPIGSRHNTWRVLLTAGSCFLLSPAGVVFRSQNARALFAEVTSSREQRATTSTTLPSI
jgi:hypothetical protein